MTTTKPLIDLPKFTPEEIFDLKVQLGMVRKPVPNLSEVKQWGWNKSNYDVAAEHSIDYNTALGYRKLLGIPKFTKFSVIAQSWDWTKSDTEIARENKVELNTVKNWRIKLNKPPVPADRTARSRPHAPPPQPGLDYTSLDWGKCDIDLAKEIGVTRERIRQVRAKLGKPKRYKYDLNYEKFCEVFKGEKSLSLPDANKKFKITSPTFRNYCFRSGITALPGVGGFKIKYPHQLMNFRLPNAVLEKTWRTTYNYPASHRCNHQLGKPLFYVNNNGNIPEQYLDMVKAEEEKAAEYFSKTKIIFKHNGN